MSFFSTLYITITTIILRRFKIMNDCIRDPQIHVYGIYNYSVPLFITNNTLKQM